MGSQVPSPTHIKKSQHGGKVPTFEPQGNHESIMYHPLKLDLDYFMQKFSGLVLRVEV